MEYFIENESTLRFLRKEHKDWSEEKIKEEATKIWMRYVVANKEKLDAEAVKMKKQLEECLDREFLFFDPND
ncbi:MAG TPA: hypothetical protein VIN72_05650 [Lutibacter sp.]